MYFRQGDIIIRKIHGEMAGRPLPDLVLARGESSGHAHRISSGCAALFEFDNRMYLKITSELALLTHEEHDTVVLPEGMFEVLRQREYEPEGWKQAGD